MKGHLLRFLFLLLLLLRQGKNQGGALTESVSQPDDPRGFGGLL